MKVFWDRHIFEIWRNGICFDHVKRRSSAWDVIVDGLNFIVKVIQSDELLWWKSENQITGWEKLNEIAIGTAKGIAYLHEECEQRIIHYDIKSGNILLDMNFSPKVADFGLAKLCNRDNSHMIMTECKGTLGYAALELWIPYPVTHKCDVCSFEILLLEIIGRRRHHDDSLNQNQEWLPRWVWEKFEKRDLDEMMELYAECGNGFIALGEMVTPLDRKLLFVESLNIYGIPNVSRVCGGEPRLLSKEKGAKIEGNGSLLATLDYYVSMQSEIFIAASPRNRHNTLVRFSARSICF
ncbi:hypothetical protein GIB67_040365 [Kingdonia uniflora]|uniref:non-specific serine/threonine protein kinase n=1 Tax=Kingdonia uniflora TaxID=39325 RepID=A0A7J7L9J7_9MAGN|nr:hypothetical protein GIB67_040365 [Kingdonia uniflora]